MNFNSRYLSISVGVIFVVIALLNTGLLQKQSAANVAEHSPTATPESEPKKPRNYKLNFVECNSDTSQCQALVQRSLSINVASTPIYVEFLNHLNFDEPLTENNETVTALEGVLSGVDMYMGKRPIQFTKLASGQWQAPLFIGMCSDPEMLWQLDLTFSLQDGGELRGQIQFRSAWPTQ